MKPEGNGVGKVRSVSTREGLLPFGMGACGNELLCGQALCLVGLSGGSGAHEKKHKIHISP